MKKILCIGPSSKLVTGQSNSFKLTSNLLNGHVVYNDFANIFEAFLYFFKLFKAAFFGNYNVVYFTNSRTKAGFFLRDLVLLILFKSSKLIYHIHGNDFRIFYESCNPFEKFFVRVFYRKINNCIAPSNKASFFIKNHLNFSLVEYSIPNIPSNIEYDDSCKNDSKTSILFFSNITEKKGILHFLELINLVNANHDKGFEFHIVGKIIDNFEFNVIPKNVIFHGPIYDEFELSRILSSTDIHVFPSFYETELYPICLIESAFCNNFIISNRIGAVDELLDGLQFIIYEDFDSEKFKICDFIINFKSSGIHVKNNVLTKNKFSYAVYKNRVLEVLNEI